VASSSDGSFVVVWEDDNNENDIYQIYAAGFDAGGHKTFGDITVNSNSAGQQLKPAVAMASGGSFAVTWEDDNNKNNIYQIYAAGFNSTGHKTFGDITVNSESSGQQLRPDVAMTENGALIFVWEDDKNENNIFQIYAAGFDADGHKTLSDFTVNSNSSGQQLKPVVAMAANGAFVIAWEDDMNNNNYFEILARGFAGL